MTGIPAVAIPQRPSQRTIDDAAGAGTIAAPAGFWQKALNLFSHPSTSSEGDEVARV
jgi:hypothetical protein